MAKEKKMELTRVNINLPTSLVNEVKEYAEKRRINMTNAYIILLDEGLRQEEMRELAHEQLPAHLRSLQSLPPYIYEILAQAKDSRYSEDKQD